MYRVIMMSLNWHMFLIPIASVFALDWLDNESNGYKNHSCPHSVPLWLNSEIIQHSKMSSFRPTCLEAKYFRTECGYCPNYLSSSHWITGIGCLTDSGLLQKCLFYCCISEVIRMSNCKWTMLPQQLKPEAGTKLLRQINWQSTPIQVEVCQVTFVSSQSNAITDWMVNRVVNGTNLSRKVRKANSDWPEPDKFELDKIEPEDLDSPVIAVSPTPKIEGFKEPKSRSKYDFACDVKHSPARVNDVSLRKHNGMYCGNPYPCSDDCRSGDSCFVDKRRDDFITEFYCITQDNEEEPYKCNFTCCHSNVVRLYNCTWQYQTDGYVFKGNETEMVVRRVEFFPYIMEVCAVRKLNYSEMADDNGTACGWANYVNLQPLSHVVSVPSQIFQTTPFYPYCYGVDFYFIVDGSHSMGEMGFKNEIDLLSHLIGKFEFGPTQTASHIQASHDYFYSNIISRGGVILFGSDAHVEFDLKEYANDASANTDMLERIKSMQFPDSKTSNTIAALELVAKEFEQHENVRRHVRDIALLITDGAPTFDVVKHPKGLLATYHDLVDKLNSDGIDLFLVTFGDEGYNFISEFGIRADHYVHVNTTSDIPAVVQNVFDEICVLY